LVGLFSSFFGGVGSEYGIFSTLLIGSLGKTFSLI
jgi:hypothetical protein